MTAADVPVRSDFSNFGPRNRPRDPTHPGPLFEAGFSDLYPLSSSCIPNFSAIPPTNFPRNLGPTLLII
jgi:hypothetical protein